MTDSNPGGARLSVLTAPLHSRLQLKGGGQCDCGACVNAMPMTPAPVPPDPEARYVFDAAGDPWSLPDEHYAVLHKHGGVAVLSQPALAMARHFTSPAALASVPSRWPALFGDRAVRAALDEMCRTGLLTPAHAKPAPSPQMDTLIGWLHVTNRCNLRCAYCYLDRTGSAPMRPDMDATTAQRVLDSLIRTAKIHGYGNLKLKYAGGEPMLRFPFVAALHRRAQARAAEQGLHLEGVVISNGTCLNRAMAVEMQALGLRLMVSLDGLGEAHDVQRPFADRSGSAAAVQRTIEVALSCGLTPEVSVTITGRNGDAMPELMAWLLARDLPFSLNFYRETARSCSREDLRFQESRLIESMLATYRVIAAHLPQRSLLASLTDRAHLASPHLRPCAVGQNYLVFDTEGRIAKCQMAIDDPLTDVHASDPLGQVRSDVYGVQNPTVAEKDGCRHCPWRYWCAGGCPLAAYRASGDYYHTSPNCAVYRALFPEVVRLEGLRLLAQQPKAE
jgi:uncharacterized protein